jgi:hypothetical protein
VVQRVARADVENGVIQLTDAPLAIGMERSTKIVLAAGLGAAGYFAFYVS